MLSVFAGYWDGLLTVSPEPGEEPFFERVGPFKFVVEGRRVYLVPDMYGVNSTPLLPEANGGLTRAYQHYVSEDDVEFCRFMRHEIQVHYDENANVFFFDLDLDHRLPWPKLQDKAAIKVLPGVVARETMVRKLQSALHHDGVKAAQRVISSTPENVRRFLPKGAAWAAMIKEVQPD